MTRVVECAGAPRDLGWEQGRACRAALRARCSGLERLRAWLPGADAEVERPMREIRRHHPHQAEQLLGMARGAGLPVVGVEALSLAALCEPAPAIGLETKRGPRLACALPADAIVRRLRPEGGFASVELGRPALTAALIGVNEAGLAAASARPRDAGHAALLVQDCLARFDAIDGALDWCLKRPTQPGGALLLADAAGELAAVEFGAEERRVVRPSEGLLVPGVVADHRSELAKARAESRFAFDRALAAALSPSFVGVNPQSRHLRLAGPGFSV